MVFFQKKKGLTGKIINSSFEAPKGLDPKFCSTEFFNYCSQIKRKQIEKSVKSQRQKPEIKSNDDFDDNVDDDIKSNFSPSDCKGYDVQWVRAAIPALPQRAKMAEYGKRMDVAVNYFEITKGFDHIHQYQIIIFPKDLTDTEGQTEFDKQMQEADRYSIFQSGDRRKKRMALRNVIKPNKFSVFDSHSFFVIGNKFDDVDSNEFDKDYIVRFRFIRSYDCNQMINNNDPKMVTAEPERMYNLINRVRLLKANFTRLSKRGIGWFDTKKQLDNKHELRHNGNPHDIRSPKCTIMQGVNCTFRQAQTGTNQRKLGIVAGNCMKIMVDSNLHQILANVYNANNNNPAALEQFFDEHLKNKLGILSYNKRWIVMDSIVCTENENTTFPKKDKNGNNIDISYADHIKDRFNQSVPVKEFCVIKDVGGAAFLPQFINISAINEQIGNDGIEQIRQRKENESPDQTMDNIINFVRTANERSGRMREGFETSETPTTCKADILPRVRFEIMSRNNRIIECDQKEFPDANGYRQIRGFMNVHNLKRKAIVLGIMHDFNERYVFNDISQYYNDFLHKRQFPTCPFVNIVQIPCNLSNAHEDELLNLKKVVRDKRINCILHVLPNGKDGSKCKIYGTKALQFMEYCSNQPPKYQAVERGNIKKYPIWGCLEDILIKFGYSLYRIKPNLPQLPNGNKSIFENPSNFMTLAIDVNGGRPTVATMAACNDVYDPSLAHYCFHTQLLSPKKDIISIHKMKKLAKKAIWSGLKRHVLLYKCLPVHLLIVRGGVDQGQIPCIQTKEIAGIKRAIYSITHDKSNPNYATWKLKKWKPKIIFVMYNKRVSEKIFEYRHTQNGMKYSLVSQPCIVQEAITSQNIWDCLMYVGGGTRAHKKWKPSKVTILDWAHDILEDKKTKKKNVRWHIDPNEIGNLYQLLHAMHYGYGYSVPFPMGPTALPAPLLFAAHYSQWAKEMILKHDVDISTLQPHESLKKRPHHVDA